MLMGVIGTVGLSIPDTTPPTITSASTDSVAENTVLSHALTADESVTWSVVGGADQAKFEISGSTLRWASNGTKDFEIPDDANTDNDYIVSVRATDGSSNTTDQTITVTVTNLSEVWQTAFSASLTSDNTAWNGYNLRQVIASSALASVSGTQIRVTLQASSASGGFTIDHAEIGHAAVSGDAYDFDSGLMTPLTFSGGSAGATVAQAGTVLSDAVSLAFDHTKNLIIAVHFSATSAIRALNPGATGSSPYYRNAASEVSTANVSGYSLYGASVQMLTNKVEVL